MDNAITCNHLCKKYDDTYAISDLSITLKENKIYGLIGRNGAGKTTLLKLLANQLLPTDGDISIFAKSNLNKNNNTESVCLARETLCLQNTKQNIQLLDYMKIKSILYLVSQCYEFWDQKFADYLIDLFEVKTNKVYKKLSKGNQTLICAIIGLASRAPITLFDEPYSGVDPVVRQMFYDVLNEDFIHHPRTIIISTHLINEMENLFEEVIMIDKGKLLFQKSMDEIKQLAYLVEGEQSIIYKYVSQNKIIHEEKIGRFVSCALMGELTEKQKNEMVQNNIKISSLTLQQLFVYLTSKRKEKYYEN